MRNTWFGEASLQGASGRQTWVAGAAFQQDRHALRELPQFDYQFSTPSVFLQDEIALKPDRVFLTVGSKFERNDFTGLEVCRERTRGHAL